MEVKEFSIIVAMDSKRGIGLGGTLPWRFRGDLEHFRLITVGRGHNAVIMGRVTWQSLPDKFRPLPQRLNVVLSRQTLRLPTGVLRAGSLDEALALPDVVRSDEVFIIGGANVYAQVVTHPACNRIYLTEIEAEFPCDSFFPTIPASFAKISISEPMTEGDITYRFSVYEKE